MLRASETGAEFAGERNHGRDGLAELLTGDRKYFWGKIPGRIAGMAEEERKRDAMEAGEIPWERAEDSSQQGNHSQ